MVAEFLNPGAISKFQEVRFEREAHAARHVAMGTTDEEQSQIEGPVADTVASLRLRQPGFWLTDSALGVPT